jgi:ATP-binding cassette subfamily A (ABC1) protein 3
LSTGTELFTQGKALGAMILLFLLFGTAIAPFAYLLCFFMKNAAGTQTIILFITFVTGLILMIVGIVLRLISSTHEVYMDYLRFIFMLFPAHAFGDGLNSVVLIDFYSFAELGGSKMYDVYDLNIAGYNLIFLAWESVVYLLLVILIDWVLQTPWVLKMILPKAILPSEAEAEPRDMDVLEEEANVRDGLYDHPPPEAAGAPSAEAAHGTHGHTAASIILRDVKKVYSNGCFAVRGVSLGIQNGECFGLLGINGAGKTSLLGMISGEFSPSEGTASIAGLDILNDIHKIRHQIGYCPQFDSLFDLLTGREHLLLYAQIKGLKQACIGPAVDAKILEMGLTEYADREAGTYSGGNKRKLSVAMAMIGEPAIVFMDEPSTGMDPVARRSMWGIISDISTKREKCSIVLTTQSMEECEALCSRIGIMVGGVLQCLGTGSRLRDRFGLGYQIEISFTLPEVDSHDAAKLLYTDLLSASNAGAGAEAGGDIDGMLAAGDVVGLSEEQMKAICESKGHSEWVPRFTKGGSGGELLLELESNGAVGLKVFTSWWILEEYADRLYEFFHESFEGYVLRERQTARVRIEVPLHASDGELRTLSTMFGLLEAHKAALAIKEYSVAQTSLEQIFNGFAAKQQSADDAAAEKAK